ncbi:MAG: ribosome recycling factor [Acidobacteria bacterium]|nr:ribosome recycling factor [Acidobacteriota bacterium]
MTKPILDQSKIRMEKALTDFQREVATIRTGRASVSILDSVRVDYYGTPTPINQVATLGAPEPQLLTVQPWDPTSLPNLEKAIQASGLGLNPVNDGKILRVPIPALTEERRKELVKHLHTVLESHRLSLRNIRRDSNEACKKLLKEKKISEDDDRRAHEDIQKLTDREMEKLEQTSKKKEKEILEI